MRRQFTGWPRRKKDGDRDLRIPTGYLSHIIGRYSVGERPWDVFEDIWFNSFSKKGREACEARGVFYVWIQVYNQHQANIEEYKWVMGGCRCRTSS